MHPSEIPFSKAVVSDDSITITSLAHREQFVKEQATWVQVLEVNQDALEATKLVTTMKKLCTKVGKKKSDDDELVMKTTTISGFNKIGISFADDYFTVSNGVLDLIPVPYSYAAKYADQDYLFTKCMCLWQAYITGYEDEVDMEAAQGGSNAAMGRLTALMKGTRIA